MLILVSKDGMKAGYMRSFKLSPDHKLFNCQKNIYTNNYSGPGRCHLNPVIRVSITKNETRWRHVHTVQYKVLRGAHHFCEVLAETSWPQSYHKKTSDKPKLRGFLQSRWPLTFKDEKQRLRYSYRLDKNKHDHEINMESSWTQGQKNDVSRKIKIQVRSLD